MVQLQCNYAYPCLFIYTVYFHACDVPLALLPLTDLLFIYSVYFHACDVPLALLPLTDLLFIYTVYFHACDVPLALLLIYQIKQCKYYLLDDIEENGWHCNVNTTCLFIVFRCKKKLAMVVRDYSKIFNEQPATAIATCEPTRHVSRRGRIVDSLFNSRTVDG
jgi:hypothetical protein